MAEHGLATRMPARPGRPRRRSLRVLRVAGLAILACSMGLSACERRAAGGRRIENATIIGRAGTAPGQFFTPRVLATDGQSLWVIDRTGRVQRLDPQTGRCVEWFRLPETASGYPTGARVAPSPKGDGAPALWVADTHYHRVLVYAIGPMPARVEAHPFAVPEAAQIEPVVLAQFGEYGAATGQFTYPTDVLVMTEPDGKTISRIYVAEFGGSDRVQCFDGQFRWKFTIGQFGDGQNPDPKIIEFQRPANVVLSAGRDELIISDSINHRLGRFTLDGRLIKWSGHQTPSTRAGNPAQSAGDVHDGLLFRHPRGLHVLPDGTVLVTEFGGNRVQRVDLQKDVVLESWGVAGSGVGELAEPWTLEIVGERAFVADARNHRVVAFPLR